MIRLIKVEWNKLLHTPGAWVATSICLAFIALIYFVTMRGVQSGMWAPEAISPAASSSYTLAMLAGIGPLSSSIIGAVIIGQEFRYGTWPTLLTMGAGRSRIFFAKLLCLLLAVGALLSASLLAGYLISLLVSGKVGAPAFHRDTLAQLGAISAGLIFWGLVGFATALLFRSTAVGITLGVGMPVFESFISSIDGLRTWLPVWNQQALNAVAFGAEPHGMISLFASPHQPSPEQALLTLLTIALLVLGCAYTRMRTIAA